MPALGPGPVNDMAAIIGWVGRTGGICLSAIRLLHRRCLILRILRGGWRGRCEGAYRRRQDYGKQLFHSLISYAQPANDQIRARVRVGINMRDRLVKQSRDRYAGDMIIMPYSYDGHLLLCMRALYLRS
jgi:hypothetical protein